MAAVFYVKNKNVRKIKNKSCKTCNFKKLVLYLYQQLGTTIFKTTKNYYKCIPSKMPTSKKEITNAQILFFVNQKPLLMQTG